jgi:phage terminase small subunit
MKLSPKRARFVDEYLVDLNATQAAIRAGYSARSAKVTASRLLTDANVAAAIQAARNRTANKLEITRERVLQEYARIAFADIRKLFTWDEERACYVPSRDLTDDEAAAISEIQAETTRTWIGTGDDAEPADTIKLKLKTYDKKGALDSIAKYLGMFVDRHEHSGKDGGPIEVSTDDLRERITSRIAGIATRIGANGAHPGTNGRGARGA